MTVKHIQLTRLWRNEKLSYVASKRKLVKSFWQAIGQYNQNIVTFNPIWFSNSTLGNCPKQIIMERRMMHGLNDNNSYYSTVIKYQSDFLGQHYSMDSTTGSKYLFYHLMEVLGQGQILLVICYNFIKLIHMFLQIFHDFQKESNFTIWVIYERFRSLVLNFFHFPFQNLCQKIKFLK